MSEQGDETKREKLAKLAKAVLAGFIIVYLILAVMVIAVRCIALPRVNDYRQEICSVLSKSLGAEVTAAKLSPAWKAFYPVIEIEDLNIHQPGKDHNLLVSKIHGELSWSSLLKLRPIFHRLIVKAPRISIQRTGEHEFLVAGMAMNLAKNSEESSSLAWALDQTALEIQDADISYEDSRLAQPVSVMLRNANFALKQGLGGWSTGLQAQLELPGKDPAPIDIRATINRKFLGKNSNWRNWSGTLYASSDRLAFSELFKSLQILPEVKAGEGGFSLWASFSKGVIMRTITGVKVFGFRAVFHNAPIALKSLEGSFESQSSKAFFKLSSPRASICLEPKGCAKSVSFHLEKNLERPETSVLNAKADSIDIEPAFQTLLGFLKKNPASQIIHDMAPKGQLTNLQFKIQGEPSLSASWDLSTDFHALSLNSIPDSDPEFPGIPGGKNLSGHLWAGPGEGAVQIFARNGSLSFPGIFTQKNLPFKQLSGSTFWKSEPRLSLAFRQIDLENEDLKLQGDADWKDTGGAGTIKVAGRVANGMAESVYRYMPVIAGRPIAIWLEQSLRGGTASSASVEWRGPIESFPYTGRNASNGLFLVTGSFNNAELDFLPSGRRNRSGSWKTGEQWPLIKNGHGLMLFHGDRMLIAAESGETNGVSVNNVVAEIPAMGEASPSGDLLIHGYALGRAQEMIDYTKSSPISGWLGNFLDSTQISGRSSLELSLRIPFDHPEKTLASGAIAFSGNDVDLGHSIPELKKTSGILHFTQDDYWGDDLEASVWNMMARGKLSRRHDGAVLVDAKTSTGVQAARPFVNGIPAMSAVLDKIIGETDFHVRIAATSSTVDINAATNLQGISVRLPGPLAKPSWESIPSSFHWKAEADGRVVISVRYGETANGKAMLVSSPNGFQLERAAAAIGEEAKLPEKGLSLLATLQAIPVEPWMHELQPIRSVAASDSHPALDEINPVFIRVKADKLIFKARAFTQVSLALKRSLTASAASVWKARFQSQNSKGSVTYRPEHDDSPAFISANLPYLYIPKEEGRHFGRILEENTAKYLPSINLRIKQLLVEDMNLGDVQIIATAGKPSAATRLWTLNSFSMKTPGAELTASGRWVKNLKNDFTEVKGTLISHDGQKLLQSLALPSDVIHGASGQIHLSLNWKGSPKDFQVKNLNGTVSAEIGDGQFLKVEPGIAGRFLSLLSMQSLMKRLALDFKDVVGQGFAFNAINMNGNLKNGVLLTDNLAVDGSAAAILASGTVDFFKQRLDTRVLVLPNLHTEAPALALAIANPFIGIGSFLAQFALKKPLAYMLATEYRIAGPWDNLSFRKRAFASSATAPSP